HLIANAIMAFRQPFSQRQKLSYHIRQPTINHNFRLCWQLFDGGAKRDRTADLLLARQALSQLSYGPTIPQKVTLSFDVIPSTFRGPRTSFFLGHMVGPSGLEPPTSPLSGVRSNQLS